MNEKNNSLLNDVSQTPEEMLGPPKIDFIGMLMMMLVSIIIGALISTGVLISTFLTVGKFTIDSGVSPFLLAISTFFVITAAGELYVHISQKVFPFIYTKTREAHKHIAIFMIVLYFVILPVYLLVQTGGVLYAYLSHIMFAIFGIELIIAIVCQYRYILLSFYANMIAFVLTGALTAWISSSAKDSAGIFILVGLSIIAFFFSTSIIYFLKFLYYKFYILTGNDPIGSTFYEIETSERKNVEKIQNTLLQ